MADLKPCPFCGGKASLSTLNFDETETLYGVSCGNYECICTTLLPNCDTEKEAINLWNKRANEKGGAE